MIQLAYFFWHWKQDAVETSHYETALREFHVSLTHARPEGFLRSVTTAVRGAPWANAGGDAYLDRYLIANSAALDTLDDAIAAAAVHEPHYSIARLAASGIGGLSRVRLGSPLARPQAAYWFAKPVGMTYAELMSLMEPVVAAGSCALWMRKMVLGPSPEFWLEAHHDVELPTQVRASRVSLRPV